jgi:hypothetical protein
MRILSRPRKVGDAAGVSRFQKIDAGIFPGRTGQTAQRLQGRARVCKVAALGLCPGKIQPVFQTIRKQLPHVRVDFDGPIPLLKNGAVPRFDSKLIQAAERL